MNILIVGGNGFIGYHLTKKIHDLKYNYVSTFRTKKPKEKFYYLKLDLSKLEDKKKIILRFKPNIIIYLAWNGIPDYSKINSKYNLHISKKFIDFISEIRSLQKIIVSGSCFEKRKDLDAKYFSNAKLNLKNYIIKKFKYKKIKLVWIRIFYVYGNGQRENSLIPTLIRSFKKGISPKIKNLNGSNDFIFINDVIDFFVKCIQKKMNNSVLDCGYGKLYSVNDICLITEKLILKKNKFFKKTKLKQKSKINLKAKTYKWFKPKFNPNKGIKKIISEQKFQTL